jgi:hypothetical protein
MKYVKLALASLVVVPAVAFFFYKPVRVLLPEAFGVCCVENVCVDDPAERGIAVALFYTAKESLSNRQGLIINNPIIVFCSTEKCQGTFGLGKKAGFTFGAFGIVIAPRGWKEYYVAHELIHYWQADNFGSLVLLDGEPWLIEGMAYALSDDPGKELQEPFEVYRHRFSEWHRLNNDIPLRKSVGDVLR